MKNNVNVSAAEIRRECLNLAAEDERYTRYGVDKLTVAALIAADAAALHQMMAKENEWLSFAYEDDNAYHYAREDWALCKAYADFAKNNGAGYMVPEVA